ncbi:hypothetical protein BGW38_004712 [Lunasporangiospora selenospora]|uniref:Arrestin C-terminal-like domain-containing protein n=1 Tax=Lunasporangiospora selenospora TaxID=979761 RepID=A0A9P6KIY5_9FUNG|nr:hypothetical protein BGW38_004712 [Lunasporangiospora selenospora]
MAILDFSKDSQKSIGLHFHTQQIGPEGQPLYFHTPETPAVIRGHVEFRTVKETNGSDIGLNFTARAESKWTENYGQTTVSYHELEVMQEKTWDIKLNRTKPSTIAPGVTRYEFEVQLDPGLPATVRGRRGWFHYRFKAHIKRDFPRRDMAIKQCVWVYSSCLSSVSPTEPKLFKEIWNDALPYSISLPNTVLYQGQTIPMTVTFEPFLNNSILYGQELIIDSAVVKLKQYTALYEHGKIIDKKRTEKKTVINLPVLDVWPQTNQGFSKTIMVEIPGAIALAASFHSKAVIKTHCLKLIMKVRTGTIAAAEAKELRTEIDVTITAPRPEHLNNPSYGVLQNAAPPPYQIIDDSDDDGALPRHSTSSSVPAYEYHQDVKHPMGPQ